MLHNIVLLMMDLEEKKQKIPVEELNDGKGGGVSSCSCGDPVQPSLPYMDKVKVFVSLEI